VYTEGAPRHSVVNVLCTSEVIGGAGMTSKFEHILQACLDWLTSRSESAQLAEIGYGSSGGSMAVAVQQLRQLAAAHKAVRDGNPTDSSSFEALAKQLQKTGKVLSCFAVPGFCNNPACVNVSRTPCMRAHHKVLKLPHSSVLQQGLPGHTLEAAQASLQGIGCSTRSQGWWCLRIGLLLECYDFYCLHCIELDKCVSCQIG
jgi:hypothetical protein